VTQDILDEAFCRDVDSFSEVFLVDNYEHRPRNCPKLQNVCAMLFDRNDADLVAVRAGCTFTAWTEVAFAGDKMTLVAGSRDRWVLLAESPAFANFDENILSFQCQCRGE